MRAAASRVGNIAVEVVGTDLPGRRCGPDPEGIWYENIHVGPARGRETVDLVPGDAATARWSFDMLVKRGQEGELDFGGPFVAGPRDGRYLGLRWLREEDDGRFVVFRGAKFRLYEMDPDLFRAALRPGHRLVARVNLTDERGWPRCATVRPPNVTWSVEPAPQLGIRS